MSAGDWQRRYAGSKMMVAGRNYENKAFKRC
jgi:hypothetical protein